MRGCCPRTARSGAHHVFDYIELTDEYSIYEIPPLDAWIGRSIRQLDMRNRYHINVLAVKRGDDLQPMPGADYVFTGSEHVLALAGHADAEKLLKKI